MSDDRSRYGGNPPALGGMAPGPDRTAAPPAEIHAAQPASDPDATVIAARPFNPPPVQIGDVLGHTYRVEALLGRGGMGAVYRARHIVLESQHAIKIILSELSSDPKMVALMNQEAQVLRSVRNDAVVEYQGLMLDEYGRRYLVMEYVDGPSLAAELKNRRFTPSEVRALRDRVARGLAAAHAKGIFHRDVSLDNIILSGGRIENAKIIDFGIAKSTQTGERTIIGQDFAGKYAYASPEQTGMYGGKIDGRSDIYSLGLVLAGAAIGYGGKLDMGNSPSTVFQARQSVPDLDRIPEELRDEIAAMLQPRPEDRVQTMEDVVGLVAKPAGAGTAARPPAAADRRSSATRRSGLATATAAALGFVVVLGAGGAYLYFFTGKNPAPPKSDTAGRVAEVPSGPDAGGRAATAPRASPDGQASTGAGAPVPPSPAGHAPTPVTGNSDVPATIAMTPPVTAPSGHRIEIEARVQQALQGYRCSNLAGTVSEDGEVRLDGFVSSADDRARLQSTIGSIANVRAVSGTVALYGWPHCEAANLLRNAAAPVNDAAGPHLRFNSADLVYKGGDILIVRATATTEYAGYLYVDYLDADGNVVHMLPTPLHRDNAVKPGQEVTVGAPKAGGKTGDRVYEISEPFGPGLVMAISSPKPLFPGRAAEMESASDYLVILARALKAGVGDRVIGSYTLINTVPR